MNEQNDINILIAEDNDVTRDLMRAILSTRGYTIFEAIDGSTAIDVIGAQHIDLALVDLNMEPKGGFDFVRHLTSNSITIPVILVTSDDSSDLLTAANRLGIKQVLHKPVVPDLLIKSVERTLLQLGISNKQNLVVEELSPRFSPDQLMQRAIDLAERNARIEKGGPFGAVIADNGGQVLGEGTNGTTSRIDPTAHAEVMAIRQAAEKLNRADLSGCTLYCSSEPTMVAKSVILSVGISKVYYGLSHAQIGQMRPHAQNPEPVYEQLGQEAALKMFERSAKPAV